MVNEVDDHLAKIGEPHRTSLLTLRATLREIPDATEALKYGMPCFVVEDGKGVAGYNTFTHHCSYFPMSGGVLERVGGVAAKRRRCTSRSTGHRRTRPLVRALVRARLEEIADRARKRDTPATAISVAQSELRQVVGSTPNCA